MNLPGKLFKKRPSREQFVRVATSAMRRAGWSDVTYDDASFSLKSSSGQFVGLENIFRQYVGVPKRDQADFLDRWFASLRDDDVPVTFAEIAPMLTVMLRDRGEANRASAITGENRAAFIGAPQFDDLELGVMIDRPTSIGRLPAEWLATSGTTRDELFARAKKNLREKSSQALLEVAAGVYESAWQDSFDATRIVFPEIIQQIPVKGRHVAMIPDRDHLMVTGDADVPGLSFMVKRALTYYDAGPYSLTSQAYVLTDRGWRPYEMPESDDYQIRRRLFGQRSLDHEVQKRLLEVLYGDDIFIASYIVHAKQEQRVLFTMSTWTFGVKTLLPKTDYIAFVRYENEVLRVKWEDAEAVLGALPQEPDIWPPRYFVDDFPNSDQYDHLRHLRA